ncbi:MAG TPA: hypothetical protein VJT31_37210, partial [Rugosimonospora sp.]|nr:hypothetical protein [Rugosimonospora sp.]
MATLRSDQQAVLARLSRTLPGAQQPPAPTLPPRLRLSRVPGAQLRKQHPDLVNVSRPARSTFANPFTVGAEGDYPTREEAVDAYRRWMLG